MNPFQRSACKWFEYCGFSVVHVIQDDIYVVSPTDGEEKNKYGNFVLSPQGMQRIGEKLAEF